MRVPIFFTAMMAIPSFGSAEPPYALSIERHSNGAFLYLAPRISAPPGKRLRYEVATSKRGRSGLTDTRQSGALLVGESGSEALSRVTISVAEEERCDVTVRVYEGDRLVASQSLRHP